MTSHSPAIGICVPVLNEVHTVESLVRRVEAQLAGGKYRLVFVDDHSTDGTWEVLQRLAAQDPGIHLIRRQRTGVGCQRGGATRLGLSWLVSQPDVELFVDLDADGSQRPEELTTGIDTLVKTGADVIIASKYHPQSTVVGRPWPRTLGSKGFSALMSLLMRASIRDYSNSYRFYNRRAAQLACSFQPGYAGPLFLLEMLAVWLANGLSVQEMATLYDVRSGGHSKVIVRDMVAGVAGALNIALRYRMGRYRTTVSADGASLS